MIEVRIHGRGGQGNVVAAYLLAITAFEEGWVGQAFPAFGAERRGAPVTAFVRISEHPVRRRCQVLEPGYLIIQDEALLQVPGVTDGLLPEGRILVNSSHSSEEISAIVGRDAFAMPATALAQQYLGRPLPNTALLSGFLALTGLLAPDTLVKALSQRFSGELLERNTKLIHAAAEQVPAGLWQEVSHAESA